MENSKSMISWEEWGRMITTDPGIKQYTEQYREQLKLSKNLAGTSNNQQIISDDENRRYSPWLVESIQSPMKYPIDYQQLYAQAVSLGKKVCEWGENTPEDTWVYWLTPPDVEEMKAHKERGNGWWVIEKEGAQINLEAMFNHGTDTLDEEE